jgi:hypothetical protein
MFSSFLFNNKLPFVTATVEMVNPVFDYWERFKADVMKSGICKLLQD